VLVDLAVTLVDGGECISHLATLRQQPELFGKVASTPTDWRVLDSVDEQMLARLRAAVAKAGARVWERGFSPRRLTLDLDATLVEVESENKEQAAPNWKLGFGYHPQRVSLDQTGGPLGGILRPGNAGANTAQDHIELLNEALSQLPLPAWGPEPGALASAQAPACKTTGSTASPETGVEPATFSLASIRGWTVCSGVPGCEHPKSTDLLLRAAREGPHLHPAVGDCRRAGVRARGAAMGVR
jgi:hypothetical protein